MPPWIFVSLRWTLTRLCASASSSFSSSPSWLRGHPFLGFRLRASAPLRHRDTPRRPSVTAANAKAGSVCRQPEPTLRAPTGPSSCASSHTRRSPCAQRCFGCVFRTCFRLCATDNDRCTNTAALPTDPPSAWRGGHVIAPSWFLSSCLRGFVVMPSWFLSWRLCVSASS